MYEKRRPIKRPVIFIFIIAAFIISACGSRIANNSWPGITADGDVVYVAYGAGVMAVDVVQEKQLWTYPVESSPSLQFYAEPSVEDGHVVVGDYGASGGMFSPGVTVSIYDLEVSDGDVSTLWTQSELAKDRIVAAPVQGEGLIFVGTADNFVLALDSENGDKVWQFEAEHSIWAAPTYENGVLYFGSLDKNIYALNTEAVEIEDSKVPGDCENNDRCKWKKELGGSVSGQVAVGESLVYAGSFDKQLHALDKETGEIRWEVPENGTDDWVWAGPALVDNVVYFSDKSGNVFAVDAETGQTIWDVQLDTQVVASPVVSNGIVFIASAGQVTNGDEIRRGAVIALSTDTGEELWRQETSAPIYSTPAIVQDKVVIALPPGAEALLIVLNQADGAETWRYSLPVEG